MLLCPVVSSWNVLESDSVYEAYPSLQGADAVFEAIRGVLPSRKAEDPAPRPGCWCQALPASAGHAGTGAVSPGATVCEC
jgi:hypothetical protein